MAAVDRTTTSRSSASSTGPVVCAARLLGYRWGNLSYLGWCAAIGIIALLSSSGVRAGTWPQPAGGPSASGAPEIVLTFDDGPHTTYTPIILDELERRGIQAIFFWVGHRVIHRSRVQEIVNLIQRTVGDGHLIANHTINHPNLCLIEPDEAAYEIDENTRLYEQLSGLPILLFRSPYGARCKRLDEMLAARSLSHLHWDIDPQEWNHRDAKRVTEHVVEKIKYLDGRAVVLMHDTKKTSVRALPEILDWIEEENRRRRDSGSKPPIRIISGSELVAERLDPGLPHWLVRTADRSMDGFISALTQLIP